MSVIKLNHEVLNEAIADVATASTDFADEIASCRSTLGGLHDAFQGVTAAAFSERYTEWEAAANQLTEALEGLSRWLSERNEIVAQWDQQVGANIA